MTNIPLSVEPSRSQVSVTLPWVEMVIIAAMLVVALISGSLALLGESMRIGLITMIDVWAIFILSRKSGGRLSHYEFGTGKLEQAFNLMIASVIIVAGLWLAESAFSAFGVGVGKARPEGMALAAAIKALFTLQYGLQAATQRIDRRRQGSQNIAALRPPALARFSNSLVVLVAMTFAAVARDPQVSLWADCFGALYICILMLAGGVRLFWGAASDLIDHPLDQATVARIRHRLFEQGIKPNELIDIRARVSGRDIFVELTVTPDRADSFESTRRRFAQLHQALEAEFEGIDVAIKLHRAASPH